jgi:hypothetical protein
MGTHLKGIQEFTSTLPIYFFFGPDLCSLQDLVKIYFFRLLFFSL